MRWRQLPALAVTVLALALAACGPRGPWADDPPAAPGKGDTTAAWPDPGDGRLRVLAAESFLADIVREVAGDRALVHTLVPVGVDPHAYQPTPADLRLLAEAQVLVVNGVGLEAFLGDLLAAAGEGKPVIEAAAGIPLRKVADKAVVAGTADEVDLTESVAGDHGGHDHQEGDPHLWLDPLLVQRYVDTIAAGLAAADPGGGAVYSANARAYQAQLAALDTEIRGLLAAIPTERRLLVTNHESLGYFADRYGLTVVGAILPSVTTGAEPSAGELAALVERIRATGAPAVFLETGVNPQLARQLAEETGLRVVTDLYTESLTDAAGPAPSYMAMMRHDARAIAAGLGGGPPSTVDADSAADPLSGLRPGPASQVADPALATVIASRAIGAVAIRRTVYTDKTNSRAAVTATLVSYAEPKGARMLFNGFVAERTSMPSADRRDLAIGDQAEGAEMGWPPYHAVYAREGLRFVLVEASDAFGPSQRRSTVLEALAKALLAGS